MTTEDFEALPEFALFISAGVTPSEVAMHPTLGCMVNEAALRKLAAHALDPDLAKQVIDWLDTEVLPEIKKRKLSCSTSRTSSG